VEYPENKIFPYFQWQENNHVEKSFNSQKTSRFPNHAQSISYENEGIQEREEEVDLSQVKICLWLLSVLLSQVGTIWLKAGKKW
jgi:hypothetical protein